MSPCRGSATPFRNAQALENLPNALAFNPRFRLPNGLLSNRALAQFERRLIQERTRAGLSAARARGRKGGRKPLDPNAPRIQMAKTMYQDKSMQVRDICQMLRISRSTLHRWIASQQQ